MSVNTGINPAQDDGVVSIQPGTVTYIREPPPPYSSTEFVNNVSRPHLVQRIIVPPPPLKHGPMSYTCPKCEERVLTRVEYVSTKGTHMLAGFICGFACWCMLCCLAAVPYFVPFFKKAEHYCPNCNSLIGEYSKLF